MWQLIDVILLVGCVIFGIPLVIALGMRSARLVVFMLDLFDRVWDAVFQRADPDLLLLWAIWFL
jgi:hypothetical protein